jgi:hypothetical protein
MDVFTLVRVNLLPVMDIITFAATGDAKDAPKEWVEHLSFNTHLS